MTGRDSGAEDASPRVGAAAPDPTGELTVQQASELLNVPAPTLRSWERRYQVPHADRSSGGHRRYTPAQLDQLFAMRNLISAGRRPVEAAALVRAGYATSPEPLVSAFLQAALELAPTSIAATLDIARETLGLDRTVDEVLLPAMRQVGEEWHRGRFDISHEHLATNATQAWFSTLRPLGPVRPHPPIILSCGPLDHHSLALEAIGALLRQRLWDCRVLGARTPALSLARAVADTDAAAVIMVCHVAAGRRAAIEALRSPQLHRRHLFFAGGAFESGPARQGVPGHYLGTNLTQATDHITDVLTSTSPHPP